MGYDVSALQDYTKINSTVLLTKSILEARTLAFIKSKGTVMTGIKTSERVHDFDTDAVFQDGKGCGFNASGSTKLSEREIVVGTIKVQEAYCPADLEAKYTQLELQAGQAYDSMIFAKEYSELKSQKIALAMDTAVWSGDTASANAQLKRFDGFRKIIKAAVGVVDANVTGGAFTEITIAGGGITKTNVISILDQMYDKIPAALLQKQDMFVACGWDVFRLYVRAIRDANLIHYDSKEALAAGEIKILGTNVSLIAFDGLTGTNELYSTYWKNLWFGTDLLNEEDKFEIFHAKEADEVRFSAKWKAGVQVGFPTEIVKFIVD